jgi:hypothetical protein
MAMSDCSTGLRSVRVGKGKRCGGGEGSAAAAGTRCRSPPPGNSCAASPRPRTPRRRRDRCADLIHRALGTGSRMYLTPLYPSPVTGYYSYIVIYSLGSHCTAALPMARPVRLIRSPRSRPRNRYCSARSASSHPGGSDLQTLTSETEKLNRKTQNRAPPHPPSGNPTRSAGGRRRPSRANLGPLPKNQKSYSSSYQKRWDPALVIIHGGRGGKGGKVGGGGGAWRI